MAHHLAKTYNCHVQIVYLIDKLQRLDRPLEINGLKGHCQHDISIVQSRFWSLVLRTVDKLDSRKLTRKINLSKRLRIKSFDTSYGFKIENKKKPRFVRGYFQSYELVNEQRSIIHSELSNHFSQVTPIKSALNSYCVLHIRRGDTINEGIGILSINHYATHVIREKLLIICTDDDSIVQKIDERFADAMVLTPKESSTWQVLKIMANADALVMANSSLSWWGGWFMLESNKKKVVFPTPWRPYDLQITENLVLKNALIVDSIFEER
jgi:hypothetical protein